MQLELFLLRNEKITKDEYIAVVKKQQSEALKSSGGLRPFAHVLGDHEFEAIRARLGNMEALLNEWHEWHVNNLQPICEYPLASKFGGQMYVQQLEKQLVAIAAATSYRRTV